MRKLIFLLVLSSLLYADFQYNGNSYNIISADQHTDDTYFENWTKLDFRYKQVSAGLQVEAHKPPLPYSMDTTGYGLYQRYLKYSGDHFQITVGNFYKMLGRGLVLRSFENRSLRWDTNIDGVNLNFQTKYLDGKVLSGKPRDRSGVRLNRIDGGELRLKPLAFLDIGSTFLATSDMNDNALQRGSFFTNLNFPTASIAAEYASRKDSNTDWGKGHALYLSADFFVEAMTFRTEFKDYDNFHLYHNSLYDYNNPPTVVREHLYTLLNRHQHVINANNEQGWLIETIMPVTDVGMSTVNYNRTNNHNGDKLFEEYYGQFELFYPNDWNWVLAAGHEKDREARYLNAVFSAAYNIDYTNAVKIIYEHQHVKILLNERQFYSHILHLEYSRAPHFTISMIAERTTEQFSEKQFWLGFQCDLQLFSRYELSLFGGTRREGKMCAGGVCVYKPEFEGVEATLQIRL